MHSDPPHGIERRMRPLLGTFVEIGVCHASLNTRALDCAYAEIERVHQLLSFHDKDSDLSRLNLNAGEFVCLSPVSLRALRLACAMSRASGGLFNCTVGGALVHRGVLPDHGGPDPIASGDESDIEIRADKARLVRPVRITLDGMAKGYAVDRAIAALKKHGAVGGWVNAGGDIRAFGSVTLPISRRESDGSLRTLGGLRDSAIATSVVRNEVDADFPSEVLDRNGNPIACGTWTVLASSAWRADALTKVAALASVVQRDALLASLGGRLINLPSSMH